MHVFYRAIAMVLTLLLFFPAEGKVLFVKKGGKGDGSSWANAYGELQEALLSATTGDSIWVASGIYYPISCVDCSDEERKVSFEIKSGIQLFGGFEGIELRLEDRKIHAYPTVLSGNIDRDNSLMYNAYSVIYMEAVSNGTSLDGFIVEGGYADGLGPIGEKTNCGGGVFVKSAGSNTTTTPAFLNSIFRNNYARFFGGAFYLECDFEGKNNAVFEKCYFQSNTSDLEGGAVYINASFQGISTSRWSYCSFGENHSGGNGGAFVISGAESGQFEDAFYSCVFEKNTAFGNGGGIFSFAKNGTGNLSFDNCTFIENSANQGGAMYLDASFAGNQKPKIDQCWFLENSSTIDGGAVYCLSAPDGWLAADIVDTYFLRNSCGSSGAAIFNNGSQSGDVISSINRCKFELNETPNYGGAIYNLGQSGNASPIILNSLFDRNTAYSAGAIYNLGAGNGNASPTIVNCSFFSNQSQVGSAIYNNGTDSTGSAKPQIYNSVFQGNESPTGRIFRNIFGFPTVQNCFFDTDNCLSLNDGLSSAVICAPGNIFSYQTQIEGVEDFHLLPNVQSVDAGLDSILVALNCQYDLDRRERIIGLSTDIGCFEQNDQLPFIPYLKFSPSSQTACAGDSLSFKVLVGNNNQYSIQWKHNGIILQKSLDTVLLLQNIGSNSQGIYQVTIIGEGDTIKGAPFSLNILPEPIFFGKIFLPDTAFCPVDSIIIYTGSSDNNNVRGEFSIEINDDTILQLDQDTIILQFLPGKYDVTLKVDYTSECGKSFSIEKEVVHFTVAPDSIPQLTISGPDTSFCEGTLVSFLPGNQEIIDSSQLLWFINGELIQENRLLLETNRLKDGDQIFYKWICIDCICVPQSQNFFSDTITVQVEDCISQVDEKNEKSQVYKVYPNPGSGTIKINTSFEVSNIKLFNLSGNKVFEKGILDQKGVISVSIRDIQEGLYLLFIQSDKDVFQEWIYISN